MPPGQALLEWEQGEMNRLVADVFGFHALQLGLPELDALRCNRMQHRWLALDAAYQGWVPPAGAGMACDEGPPDVSLRCDFEALPFPSQSLDLVVLPHALELAQDPHHTLREVARVLVPGGRVVIAGFNPVSLWGLRQRVGCWGHQRAMVLPQGEFIGYWRLRDWLRLLDLEVDTGHFGVYRPMLSSESWWSRLQWMEALGSRWWPVFGAVYFVSAVKRVPGMRLIGKPRKARVTATAAPVVATNRQRRAGLDGHVK